MNFTQEPIHVDDISSSMDSNITDSEGSMANTKAVPKRTAQLRLGL